MKGKTKTQKGITLVALIITIVVLLILAVVAITAIQDEDLIGKVNSAATTYNQSVDNETEQLVNYAGYLDQYLTGGNKYSIGDEVIVMNGENEERFYVMGETATNLLLLPKLTVNQETNKQANGTSFSLEEVENSEEAVTVLNTAANAYGAQLGGTGRLMTKAEADTLYGSTVGQEILKGANTSWGAGNGYYLGTTTETEYRYALYIVQVSTTPVIRVSTSYDAEIFSLRPVVEIAKDKVTPVSE